MNPHLNNAPHNTRQFVPQNALPMNKLHNKILAPAPGSSTYSGPLVAPNLNGLNPNFKKSQYRQEN